MTVFEPKVARTNFRAAVKSLSPPWLAGDVGYRFMYSLAIQLDTIAEYMRIGVLQRFPTYCEEEALPYLGKDRRIQRGPNESADSYRERLRIAFITWKTAGHPKAVLAQLAAYYSPTPPVLRYVSNGYDENGNTVTDWWTLSAGTYSHQRQTPSNWDWDGTFGNYRFWIIAYVPLLSGWNWDDGHAWDQPGLLWDYKDGQAVADLRNIINVWKCAGSHCESIIFASATTQRFIRWGEFNWADGTWWGATTSVPLFDPSTPPGQPMPDGTWGDIANRDPNAQYFPGI